jgi:hypothetical protein
MTNIQIATLIFIVGIVLISGFLCIAIPMFNEFVDLLSESQNIEDKSKSELIEICKIQQQELRKISIHKLKVKPNQFDGRDGNGYQPFRDGEVIDNSAPPEPLSHRFASGGVFEIPEPSKPPGPRNTTFKGNGDKKILTVTLLCIICTLIGYLFGTIFQ